MSWTRQGDNARSHPVMMRARTVAVDDREPAEFFGVVAMAYEYSGEHYTDYQILEGAMYQICDSRDQAMRMIKLGLRTKVLRKIKMDGLPGYELLNDDAFFHIITRAEREMKLQHRNDTRNTELTSRVRLRDGDQCRWCGKLVLFGNTRNHKGGKYNRTDLIGPVDSTEVGSMDHLDKQQATFDTLVVACMACNQRRGDPEASHSDWLIRPVPTNPYYSVKTAEFLANNGYQVEPSDSRPDYTSDTATKRPRVKRDTALSDPDSVRTPRPVDLGSTRTPTPDARPVADPPGPMSVKVRSAGSGRGGSGGVGTGFTGKRSRRGKASP